MKKCVSLWQPARSLSFATISPGNSQKWSTGASVDHLNCGPHIPLMSLIPLLDVDTLWGRRFAGPTWRPTQPKRKNSAACGVVLGQQPTRPDHACLQKLCTREVARAAKKAAARFRRNQPSEPDEIMSHQRPANPAKTDWGRYLKELLTAVP